MEKDIANWLKNNRIRVIPYDKDYADEVYREFHYMSCANGKVGKCNDLEELELRQYNRMKYGKKE